MACKIVINAQAFEKLWKLKKKKITLRTGIFPPKTILNTNKKAEKTKTRKGVELAPNRKDILQKKS